MPSTAQPSTPSVTRQQIEDFLIAEADRRDAWGTNTQRLAHGNSDTTRSCRLNVCPETSHRKPGQCDPIGIPRIGTWSEGICVHPCLSLSLSALKFLSRVNL